MRLGKSWMNGQRIQQSTEVSKRIRGRIKIEEAFALGIYIKGPSDKADEAHRFYGAQDRRLHHKHRLQHTGGFGFFRLFLADLMPQNK